MNHFLLTRFNLRLWWKHDKRGHGVQTDDWLDERFRLFDTYCWPSVMAQTCKDFKWICLFDADTPQKYRDAIERHMREWDGFLPFFLGRDDTAHFQAFFQKKVAELSDRNDERLLTTYLDNDDCLHADYVKTVQEYTRRVDYGTMFSFMYGIQYYEDLNLAVRVPYPNNHFLSYYERLSPAGVRTVWGFWHFSIFNYRDLHLVLVKMHKRPMWIELVHKGNLDNDVKMTVRQCLVTSRDALECFGLRRTLRVRWQSWLMFVTAFQLRFAKQVARRVKNKIAHEQ